LKGREFLEDPGIDESVILELILKITCEGVEWSYVAQVGSSGDLW
jgi:hypothetical protein